jgi:hypothetical protein
MPGFIDWPRFWDTTIREDEWLVDDLLACGRSHVLYATHKDGKSLFTLSVCAELATGQRPVAVVYLDYEMTEADVRDRLADMGHGLQSDLSRLYYWLLPSLPPLDSETGARMLLQALDAVQARHPEHDLLLVIDTISRAARGPEGESDTFRDFYAYSGIELKRRNITYVRLDHAGKDLSAGPRGSSGKGDDVDVVWRLSKTRGGIVLKRDVARMPWVPDELTYVMRPHPLHFVRLDSAWPAGTDDVARDLDNLGVPLGVGRREASDALRKAGKGRSNGLVSAAVRFRRQGEEHDRRAL